MISKEEVLVLLKVFHRPLTVDEISKISLELIDRIQECLDELVQSQEILLKDSFYRTKDLHTRSFYLVNNPNMEDFRTSPFYIKKDKHNGYRLIDEIKVGDVLIHVNHQKIIAFSIVKNVNKETEKPSIVDFPIALKILYGKIEYDFIKVKEIAFEECIDGIISKLKSINGKKEYPFKWDNTLRSLSLYLFTNEAANYLFDLLAGKELLNRDIQFSRMVFSESEKNDVDDFIKEASYVRDLQNLNLDPNIDVQYPEKPKFKTESNGNSYSARSRDRNVAENALRLAEFRCEIDNKHTLFTRRNSNITYTEPHHLIPMKYYDNFNYSIDVENNIVSLCSNCHNNIHYGKDWEDLIKILYDKRKKLLEKAGLTIELADLFNMYK